MFWHHYPYLCSVSGGSENTMAMTTMSNFPKAQQLISLLFFYCSQIEWILAEELCYFNFSA